jgi:hypothetical protein
MCIGISRDIAFSTVGKRACPLAETQKLDAISTGIGGTKRLVVAIVPHYLSSTIVEETIA